MADCCQSPLLLGMGIVSAAGASHRPAALSWLLHLNKVRQQPSLQLMAAPMLLP